MPKEERVSFSVRLPVSLNRQVETRRKLHRRSKNDEIIWMLEKMIDEAVEKDFPSS